MPAMAGSKRGRFIRDPFPHISDPQCKTPSEDGGLGLVHRIPVRVCKRVCPQEEIRYTRTITAKRYYIETS